ncbi:ArdC family protein [Asticcacaulis excentricus]|nr:zincin-like metallopeptidase domain-containing protein [Asticcacaulis excentricus]
MKPNALDTLLAELINRMDQGELPWRRPWKNQATPQLPTRADGQTFSGTNLWILAMQMAMHGWSNPRFYTFNQAKDLGGHVRKGEKGCPAILYKQTAVDQADGDDPKILRFLKSYVCFNAEQIEGLPDDCYLVSEAKAVDPDAVNAFFRSIEFKLIHKGDMAFYNPENDQIVMPNPAQFEDLDRYNATLGHELVHWTGAKNRLDRKLETYRYHDCRAREELVAELGALQLGLLIGLPVEEKLFDNHAGYLQSWVRLLKDHPGELIKASGQASRAVDFLFAQSQRTAQPLPVAA